MILIIIKTCLLKFQDGKESKMMNKHQLMRLQLSLKKLKLLLPKRLHQNNKLNKSLLKQQKLLLINNQLRKLKLPLLRLPPRKLKLKFKLNSKLKLKIKKLPKLRLPLEQNIKLNSWENKKQKLPRIKKEVKFLYKQRLLNKLLPLLQLQILYYQKIKNGVKCHWQKRNWKNWKMQKQKKKKLLKKQEKIQRLMQMENTF